MLSAARRVCPTCGVYVCLYVLARFFCRCGTSTRRRQRQNRPPHRHTTGETHQHHAPYERRRVHTHPSLVVDLRTRVYVLATGVRYVGCLLLSLCVALLVLSF